MTNYDIEMWRYSKELKRQSPDAALDFDHVKSKSALLQNVDIRLNEWGLRGGPVQPTPPGGRRILFLGGSVTLGWRINRHGRCIPVPQFRKFRPPATIFVPNRQGDSDACSKIPYAMEQGIFKGISGNASGGTGIHLKNNRCLREAIRPSIAGVRVSNGSTHPSVSVEMEIE